MGTPFSPISMHAFVFNEGIILGISVARDCLRTMTWTLWRILLLHQQVIIYIIFHTIGKNILVIYIRFFVLNINKAMKNDTIFMYIV